MDEMRKISVSSLLYDLLKYSLENLIKYKNDKKMPLAKIKYLKPKIDNFKYNRGKVQYNLSFQCTEDEIWNNFHKYEFINNIITPNILYSDCLNTISKKYKLEADKCDLYLKKFLILNFNSDIKSIDDKQVFEQVTTFINDLNGNSMEWEINIWLSGIWLKGNKYILNDELSIRRPIKEDFEEVKGDKYTPIDFNKQLQSHASSILSFRTSGKNYDDVSKKVDNVLNILNLFRLGGVKSIRTNYQSKSFLQEVSTEYDKSQYTSTFTYSITSEDIPKLKQYIKYLQNTELFNGLSYHENEHVELFYLAYKRYKDALTNSMSLENRITSAISCLEAIYLKDMERMELSHRLSQRTASLLRLFGFNALEVYEDVIQAYEIRSTFIHGSLIKNELRKPLDKLCRTILEYSRVSLLIFIQLGKNIEKDKLINKLDNSLLDNKSMERLKLIIDKSIKLKI